MIKSKQKHSKAGLKENRRKLTNDIAKAAMGVKMLCKVKDLKKDRD
jgi:hypothetical protein